MPDQPVSDSLIEREATAALRAGTEARLVEGFDRYVATVLAQHGWDSRDEMIDLTPFVDCARRLGLEPAAVLAPRVAHAPDWLRDLVPVFAARPDATLETFGWRLVASADGPAYRWGVER